MKISPYNIIYEDDDILVVYKQRNVFTIKTLDKKTFNYNLFHYLYEYLKKKGERPYIVHRLDYETSGLLIFAKNEELQYKLRQCFEERKVRREYEAVVLEQLERGKTYHVEQYLSEGKNGQKVIVTDEDNGRIAITDIKVENPIQIGTSLKIEIKTGRRNQIRLALKSLGLTLIGDKRYALHEAKRMYLNAYRLSFPIELGLKQSVFETAPLWIDCKH